LDGQTRVGGGGDGRDDHFVAGQRAATPVHRGVTEQAVLDFVPLGCAWRQVSDGDPQSGLGGQVRQFGFPQPGAVTVRPAAVGANQQPGGRGVQRLPDVFPPAADRLDGEGGGVVIGANSNTAKWSES